MHLPTDLFVEIKQGFFINWTFLISKKLLMFSTYLHGWAPASLKFGRIPRHSLPLPVKGDDDDDHDDDDGYHR